MITFYKYKFFQHIFRQVKLPTFNQKNEKGIAFLNITEAISRKTNVRFFEAFMGYGFLKVSIYIIKNQYRENDLGDLFVIK